VLRTAERGQFVDEVLEGWCCVVVRGCGWEAHVRELHGRWRILEARCEGGRRGERAQVGRVQLFGECVYERWEIGRRMNTYTGLVYYDHCVEVAEVGVG